MIDGKKIEQIAKQITDSIPPGFKDLADNMETRVKQTLQQQLNKLDVVTREEFEVQQQMMLRLRQRIEALEQVQQAQVQAEAEEKAKQNPEETD